jgi:hypothetical protein
VELTFNNQTQGIEIMTNREIRRYNAANRQGYTWNQTVFFHLAMGALVGLTPFAIALILS